MPKKSFTKVWFLRVTDTLHTAAMQEADARGFPDTVSFIRELVREAVAERLKAMATLANPLQATLPHTDSHPPAPPQGGERPEGAQDGSESEICPRCKGPVNAPQHENGCPGPATVRPPPMPRSKRGRRRAPAAPTTPKAALADVKRAVARAKKKTTKKPSPAPKKKLAKKRGRK